MTIREMGERPRLLDLFCGAGGAAMGYHRAGFKVVGVDIKPQPRYPFEFIQADALDFLAFVRKSQILMPLEGFSAIHASPPCQAFTAMGTMANARHHEDLLTPTLALLDVMGKPYVVENVMGAPMRSAVRLCGTTFGLKSHVPGRGIVELRRHRLFELNWPLLVPPCAHKRGRMVVGFYGDHARIRRRSADGGDITGSIEKLRLVKEAMGIDWMTWSEANQAIPPAYTHYIGTQLLASLQGER
jgi:DNA (cytosine-5)-methyltransferase 1